MGIRSPVRYFAIFLSVAYLSQVAYKFFSRRKQEDTKNEIHEVIIFSPLTLMPKNSKYSRHTITPPMDRLLHYLSTPRETLDICMYVFTSQEIMNAILKVIYRGVKVRVIVDADMAFATGSQVRKLEKQGVPVRWMKSTSLMHHKFFLVDVLCEPPSRAIPLLATGSLNWTAQAMNGNWEGVTVTSEKDLIAPYREEFERLWVQFKPIVPHSPQYTNVARQASNRN
ncbi:mitochondrial cardiolipin hydrolase [Plutella xylostella]|uniref:mitochondrial cardiolipin hydrolase n=1 Tax=Plutella xylostella TaxID=51655 RepID=UPI0018D1C08D|nr:mitochondrial cardiolipin hydrolase [Plutella xylostella]